MRPHQDPRHRPRLHPWPVVALVLTVLAAAFAPARSARAEITFGVAPSRVELAADPGADGRQTLTVGNGGDEPFEVTAQVQPYKEATGEQSAVAWLAVEPATFRIEPGAEQEVEVTIRVPGGLEAGGRYAAVAFTTGASATGGTGAAMAGQIVVPFLIGVDGDGELTRRASLARFAPFLGWDGRVGFVALLRNEGNLHLFPAGTVEVGPVAGEPIGRLEIQPTTALLPGSEIELPAQGTLPLTTGSDYRAAASVDYGGEEPAVAEVEFSSEVAVAVTETAVCENLDRGPTARFALRNDGQLGLQPVVQLAVLAADGAQVASSLLPAPPTVWPGETTEVALDVADRLLSGDYVLAVRVDYAPPTPDGATFLPPVETTTAFRIGGLGGEAAPLCSSPTGATG